jgi:hypothetical protein
MQDDDDLPDELKTDKHQFHWDKSTLEDFAKTTFCGFK